MSVHTKLRSLFLLIALVTSGFLLALVFLCTKDGCYDSPSTQNIKAEGESETFISVDHLQSGVVKEYHFDTEGDDIMVFLHMQKTGGTTFGRHLVKNLDIKNPCDCAPKRKRCDCKRPNSDKIWLFSRYSIGWLCGLHADWTELQACLPTLMNKMQGKNRNREFLYFTIIRDPVARYVSEFRCNQRGATWRGALHMCNGRVPTKEELPQCYSGEDWTDVTLEEFMSCPSNLAINRQTRMLADLKLVGCYNASAMSRARKETTLLESAKRNLENMAYFALVEYQLESQYLFEKMFGLKFIRPFTQVNEGETRAGSIAPNIDSSTLTRIKQLVNLDIELYSFAQDLFFKRLKYFKDKDSLATNTS